MAKRDYLVDAAKQIRMALDREVNEDYEAAFSYYKNGVDLLLNGVQVDPNKERREAVKRKTTQYLKRAEEIFISHLQSNFSKGTTQLGGYSSLRFRSIRHLSSPVEDLEMCKVVGVIDKVLTVQNLISKEKFVIKADSIDETPRSPHLMKLSTLIRLKAHVPHGPMHLRFLKPENKMPESLPKSSWENRERPTIIPQGVPFMVKLLRYYVSEDSVFLHLEHVQGSRLFSKLHRMRTEVTREHPECFSPSQHKIQLKNSYTSPDLRQLFPLNGGVSSGMPALLETENLERPDTGSLASWKETQHRLDSCGTHTYCEETGCLQNSRLEKIELQQVRSLSSCAIRTDSLSHVNLANVHTNRCISQDSLPLPVHPCVIVDTRDPLSATSDLLGNDVRVERVDSSLDFDKAWNAAEPAQNHRDFTATGPNSDILGIKSVAQITLSSLFGGETQPALCTTVNVLPQKVRIVPNTLPLPPQNQKQENISHVQTTCSSQNVVSSENSQFMACLSSENSQIRTSSVESKLRPASLSLDLIMDPQVNNTSKTFLREMQRDSIEIGEESWELLSPLCKEAAKDTNSSLPAGNTISSSHKQTGPVEVDDEQFLEVDGWCHLPQFRPSSSGVKHQGQWGLPEEEVRLWGAQILLALESIHEQGIICQDLNPRNILLNSNGKVCLTYFGQWTEVQPEISHKAMDQMYCAPEIGGVFRVTEACDWWSLGALLFELLTGMPLWQCHPTGIHPHTQLLIPDHLSTAAASLLTELLQYDAGHRLGSGGGGVSDIKCHPFFSSVPWQTLDSLMS